MAAKVQFQIARKEAVRIHAFDLFVSCSNPTNTVSLTTVSRALPLGAQKRENGAITVCPSICLFNSGSIDGADFFCVREIFISCYPAAVDTQRLRNTTSNKPLGTALFLCSNAGA